MPDGGTAAGPALRSVGPVRLADVERTSPTWSAPARGRHHTWALPGQTRQTGAHTHPTVRHVTLSEWRPGMAVRYIPTPLHDATASWGAWRIRLVAYGARLESVLGASPRGFESPILRPRPREPTAPGSSRSCRRRRRRGRRAGALVGHLPHRRVHPPPIGARSTDRCGKNAPVGAQRTRQGRAHPSVLTAPGDAPGGTLIPSASAPAPAHRLARSDQRSRSLREDCQFCCRTPTPADPHSR